MSEEYSFTSLYVAGHSDVCRLLVEEFGAVGSVGLGGATPLHFAATSCDVEAIRALVSLGADVNARDGAGCSALHWVSGYGRADVAALIISLGADVDAVAVAGGEGGASGGSTPLHYAADNGCEAIVSLLLAHGASVGALGEEEKEQREGRYDEGSTPLHCAARNGHAGTVLALLANGVDISAVDGSGRPPIALGVEGRSDAVVLALSDEGAVERVQAPAAVRSVSGEKPVRDVGRAARV